MALNEPGYKKKWQYRYREHCNGCNYLMEHRCTKYGQNLTMADRKPRLPYCQVMRPIKVKKERE